MRHPVWGITRDQYGQVVTYATVTVYKAGTSELAVVYEAASGGTPVNTVTSDGVTGYYVFYVDQTEYLMQGFDLTIAKPGFTTTTVANVYPAFNDYWIDARADVDDAYTDEDIQAVLDAIADKTVEDPDYKATLLLYPGTWTLSASITIPSNVTLKVSRGTSIVIGTGRVLLVNGSFEAGPYPLFSGNGTIAFGENAAQLVDVTWWYAGSWPTALTKMRASLSSIGSVTEGAIISPVKTLQIQAGRSLDVSPGILVLADDQISGDKVEGGTINAIEITTLNAPTANITTLNATNAVIDNASLNLGSASLPVFTDASKNLVTKSIEDTLAALGLVNAVVYKGAIDCGTSPTPNYPAADAGHAYAISVSGRIGGPLGPVVIAGDVLICKQDNSPEGDQAAVGDNWDIVEANIDLSNILITGGRIDNTKIGTSVPEEANFTKVSIGGYLAVRTDGSFAPSSLEDGDAPNNSIYYSLTSSKLVYKDPAGSVNALY